MRKKGLYILFSLILFLYNIAAEIYPLFNEILKNEYICSWYIRQNFKHYTDNSFGYIIVSPEKDYNSIEKVLNRYNDRFNLHTAITIQVESNILDSIYDGLLGQIDDILTTKYNTNNSKIVFVNSRIYFLYPKTISLENLVDQSKKINVILEDEFSDIEFNECVVVVQRDLISITEDNLNSIVKDTTYINLLEHNMFSETMKNATYSLFFSPGYISNEILFLTKGLPLKESITSFNSIIDETVEGKNVRPKIGTEIEIITKNKIIDGYNTLLLYDLERQFGSENILRYLIRYDQQSIIITINYEILIDKHDEILSIISSFFDSNGYIVEQINIL